jgi:hypothetical protein
MPSFSFTATPPPLPKEPNDARSTPPPLPRSAVAAAAWGRKLVLELTTAKIRLQYHRRSDLCKFSNLFKLSSAPMRVATR